MTGVTIFSALVGFWSGEETRQLALVTDIEIEGVAEKCNAEIRTLQRVFVSNGNICFTFTMRVRVRMRKRILTV